MILLVLIASFQQIILLSVYQLNKDFFTKNFCENINAPEKKCNGQCYINKTIAKQEEQNNKDLNFKWKEVEVFFNTSEITVVKKIIAINTTQLYFNYTTETIVGMSAKILHPPQA